MIRIGILCPSEIAFRRFLPAVSENNEFRYVGVAVATKEEWYAENSNSINDEIFVAIREKELEKARKFQEEYSGEIFESYEELLNSEEIDAVYLPLPPALHYKWAKKALENGKHTLVEKPATTDLADTQDLISLAAEKELALHENYMFAFHEQLKEIQTIVDEGKIGDVRMYRIDFGFPRRANGDFRYMKALGGGALLDCGGYTVKYATMLLGETAKLDYAKLNYTDGCEVDLYGSAALSNDEGQVVQIAFGMDNAYKCDLEIWGSRARLLTGRVLTAPAGFVPKYKIIDAAGEEEYTFSADDTFTKSLQFFALCIEEREKRKESYVQIGRQAELIADFMKKAGI